MVLDPIPQSLPVHFFGSRPQPPTSCVRFLGCMRFERCKGYSVQARIQGACVHEYVHVRTYMCAEITRVPNTSRFEWGDIYISLNNTSWVRTTHCTFSMSAGTLLLDASCHTGMAHVTHTSHTRHTHVTHTSHTRHTHVTHTSHTPHTHVTHTSHTHHTMNDSHHKHEKITAQQPGGHTLLLE